MAKKAIITQEQRDIAIRLLAANKPKTEIMRQTGLSRFVVLKLLDSVELNKAIDRVRMTETIPGLIEKLASTNALLVDAMSALETRMAAVEQLGRITRKALLRLQVENKDLRETRKKAKQELARAKRDLWKARGY